VTRSLLLAAYGAVAFPVLVQGLAVRRRLVRLYPRLTEAEKHVNAA
jgi:hypothetical protein